MKTPFCEASYFSQVRRLTALAHLAVAEYPIKLKSIRFIQHGENATFRLETSKSQTFLLRIHRSDYHTESAITNEMAWLRRLALKGLSVPDPMISKSGKLVESIRHPDLEGPRNCTMLRWVHGNFKRKSIKPIHMFAIGQLIAELHGNSQKGRAKERCYWTSAGLVGPQPKFGSLDNLSGVTASQQSALTSARKFVFRKLRQFETQHPQRQGLIHADLHFGNIVWTGNGPGAIDFDDCGFGFFAYDLVIPYLSVQKSLDKMDEHTLSKYKSALIAGYKTKRNWDQHDEGIFRLLVTARKLLMLGWLNSRSDNPRLKQYYKLAIKSALAHLKTF